MARPQNIQKLRHGKILSKTVFPSFVETWNYVTNRVENLKGDADVRPETGCIKVDNTDPEHPVIRLVNVTLSGNGGGGGGSGAGYPEPWTFDMVNDVIMYPYFQVGTYRAEADVSDISLSAFADLDTTKTVWCNIDIANLSAKASYERSSDWSHFPVEVFQLSCLSAGTGEIDEETGEEISALSRQFFYKCRYPLAPVWECYSV